MPNTVAVHPLLGPHVRLPEEPERHVWQAEIDPGAQPWLADYRTRQAAVLPRAAYCEMALAAAHAVLGDVAEVQDLRFEQELSLDERTTIGASASLSAPRLVDFTVETQREGGSHWTGPARSRRHRHWWARLDGRPTPWLTDGSTHSPCGAALRACRPPRSLGAPGPRLGAARPWRSAPMLAIASDEGAYAFEALTRHDRAYTSYVPTAGARWSATFAQRSPFAEAFRSVRQSPTSNGKLGAELGGLPQDERPTRLRRLISEQVNQLLRRSVDPDRPLFEYGLDSLGALELRNRIEAETGLRIASTDITTIRGLAGLLCEKLVPLEAA